ncbi:MAG: hypothetical protein RR100_09235 [Comamonas sp.]
MAEMLATTWAGGAAAVSKQTVEREAREAYTHGLSVNAGCPYPFKTPAAMHWLAHYNLCLPLPSARKARP